jgi:hypothetical protein
MAPRRVSSSSSQSRRCRRRSGGRSAGRELRHRRGATGEHDTVPANPVSSLTFYPPKSNAAGTCAPIGSAANSLSVDDKATQKGATVSFGAGDPSTGLPCTPAQVSIDPTQLPGAQTPGSWQLDVAHLQNGELGSAVLTIDDLPRRIDPATAPLYEVLADGSGASPRV